VTVPAARRGTRAPPPSVPARSHPAARVNAFERDPEPHLRSHRTTARGAPFLLLLAALCAGAASAATGKSDTKAPKRTIKGTPIVFPLVGVAAYDDNFGDPRPQGRHEGIDINVPRRSPVLAAEAGTVKWWTTSSLAGCMLYLYGGSGTTYLYIHLNNDRTLRNDNKGGCVADRTYTVDDGAKVARGEQIAWSGDSGDADGNPHLHFELHLKKDRTVDPFPYLNAGERHLYPGVVGERNAVGLQGEAHTVGDGVVEVEATSMRWWPGGRWIEIDPQLVAVAVPEDAEVDGEVATLIQGKQRVLSSRKQLSLTVVTAPEPTTEQMLAGSPGAFTAVRVRASE
jgi:murein DD-endopeptidase MepM/ murein hydrolase activator NlpD